MPRSPLASSSCCCARFSPVRKMTEGKSPRRLSNMRKAFTAIVVLAAVATSGCASLFGKRAAPNEFEVARNAPLIIPPDFSLAPPVAGTQGISAGDAQQQAIDALFGGPVARSAIESSMLEQ